MGTRSGLDAQVGFVAEATVGTAVTVSRFLEFDDEDFNFNLTWIENEGLKAGSVHKRASRVGITRKSVSGQLVLKHGTKQFGLLWKHCLGSIATATVIAATTAFKQTHVYSTRVGLSLTIQVGRPEPSTGTVKPHTFTGCKVTSWELSASENAPLTLTVSFDGWLETTATALATASFSTSQAVFSGIHCTTFTLGGTATTTTGITSIAAGTPLAAVAPTFTIKGDIPLATERYGLLGAGVKAEQLENDIPTITGTVDAEYLQSEAYALYVAQTTTAMEVNFTQGDAGSSNPFKLGFIMPAVKFKNVKPSVDGPGLVRSPIEWEAYDDGGGSNPVLQVTLVSTDTTL